MPTVWWLLPAFQTPHGSYRHDPTARILVLRSVVAYIKRHVGRECFPCIGIDPVAQYGAQLTISRDVAGATSERSVVTPVPQAAWIVFIEGLEPLLHTSPGGSHVTKHVDVKVRVFIDVPPQ